MKPPFVIFGLPRSRTFWLSRFLSYADWNCGHDELRYVRGIDDVKSWFSQPSIGTVETAGAPWWRLLRKMLPDVRVVLVRRPVADVVDSLMAMDIPWNRPGVEIAMRRLDQKLDQIQARVPGVLSFDFAELASEDGCARLFEHCLPYRHDRAWWEAMAALNLQVSMPAMIRYQHAHRQQLDKVIGQAKHITIAGMKQPKRERDGITFQQERFDPWYKDAEPLFRDHMVRTNQKVDDYTRKNLPLLRALDQMGSMQITTARCNGRMFGYLMAVISQSLDAEDQVDAMHLPFFVSEDAPGIGMRLQRASIEGLKNRKVDELYLRAGIRGDGPRLGSIYKRLGAEDFGQIYKLSLKS